MRQGEVDTPLRSDPIATAILAVLIVVLLLLLGRLGWMLYAYDLRELMEVNPRVLPAYLFGLFMRYVLPSAAALWYLLARNKGGRGARCAVMACAIVPAVQCFTIAVLIYRETGVLLLSGRVVAFLLCSAGMGYVAYRLYQQRPLGMAILLALGGAMSVCALWPGHNGQPSTDLLFLALGLLLPTLALLHARRVALPEEGLTR
jgi:hypothetical protein